MAADIKKAQDAIVRLRAFATDKADHAQGDHPAPRQQDVADLCDGFEWLYESRADLIARMESQREEAIEASEQEHEDLL